MASYSDIFSGIVSFCFFAFLCFPGNAGAAGNTDFDFGTLTLSSLKLLGDAHLSNGSVMLTRDLAVPNSGAGRVLYTKPIKFRQTGTQTLTSFSTFFSFSVANLNPSSIGGGLAFVISPDDEIVGDAGGYLGLMDGKGSPAGVVAIEFDTLMDVEFKDINGNHVGLDLNSMISTEIADLDSISVDLKSGDLVNSWVDYSGSTQLLNISVSAQAPTTRLLAPASLCLFLYLYSAFANHLLQCRLPYVHLLHPIAGPPPSSSTCHLVRRGPNPLLPPDLASGGLAPVTKEMKKKMSF